jgi:hypothetical protein
MTWQTMRDFDDNDPSPVDQQLELSDARSWVAPAMAGSAGLHLQLPSFMMGKSHGHPSHPSLIATPVRASPLASRVTEWMSLERTRLAKKFLIKISLFFVLCFFHGFQGSSSQGGLSLRSKWLLEINLTLFI